MPMLTIKERCYYTTLEQWNGPNPTPPKSQMIDAGTRLEYVAHVVGGMVKVQHNGQHVIIHPAATKELSK